MGNITIHFKAKQGNRLNSDLSNIDLARILEFKKHDNLPYLDGDKRYKPITRFLKSRTIPLSDIILDYIKGKQNKSNSKAIQQDYIKYIRDGGLPFNTYASVKRKGVSLVDTEQYINSIYVEITK